MIAGGHRLDHFSDPRRVEAGEQDRALHLCRRHRQAVGEGDGRRQPTDHQRQAASGRGGDVGAHLRQRIDDAAHRTARKAGVTDKGRGDRMTCDKAHQQAGRRAAVAHVERLARLEQAADANAVDHPLSIISAFDRGAHRAHRGGGGKHVMPFEQAGHAACPHGKRRKHQRTMRNALVAGNRDPTFERSGSGKAASCCGLMGHGVRLLTAARQSGKAHADLTDAPCGGVFFPRLISFF